MSTKNLIRLAVNTAIGIILVFLWLKLVNLEQIIKELVKVPLINLVPIIGLFAIANAIRSIRLKILLSQYKISLLNIILLNYLSQLLSFSIPLRAGEITKGVYLSTQNDLPFSKALILILLDRFFDFWVVLVVSLVLLMIVPTSLPANLKPILLILIIIFTVITLLVVLFPKLTKKIVYLVSKLLVINILKKYFIQFSEFIIDTAAQLKHNLSKLWLIFLVTIVALLIEASTWLVLLDIVFQTNISFLKVILGSFLSSLTYLIPAAPGYIGSSEASTLAVFSLGLGFNPTLTSVVAVLMHALLLLYMLVFGLISLYFLKFNLNLVWKKLREKD